MFNNKLETIIEKKSSEKDNARQELAELGAIKAGLEAEIKEAQEFANEYKELNERVAEKDIELQKIQAKVQKANVKLSDITKLELKKADSMEAAKKLNKEVKELEVYKNDLANSISDLENKQKEKELVITSTERKISNLEDSYKSLKEDNDEIIDNTKAKITDINKDIKDKKKTLVSMENKLTKVSEQYSNSLIDLEKTNQEIELANKKLLEVNKEIEIKLNEKMDEFEEFKKAQEGEITLKSGELSKREAWLKEKEEKLLDLKNKMEAFHGKTISNINI